MRNVIIESHARSIKEKYEFQRGVVVSSPSKDERCHNYCPRNVFFLGPAEMTPSKISMKSVMEATKGSEKERLVNPSKRFRYLVKGLKMFEAKISTPATTVSNPPPTENMSSDRDVHPKRSVTTKENLSLK
ncbi:unnamed protein product [Ilex paraguariensis]|uniref:Uncharacterized protein n=1 Tax=Ilex paraguariensis TaxID=185542 RepID=A0ABC8STC9_9AQUA